MNLLDLLQTMPECSKHQGFIPVNDDINIPFTILKGRKQGPVLTISAGVHGCEYVGVKTILDLSQEWKLTEEGSVILLHVVNTTGFWQRMTTLVPEDELNLNRIFQDQVSNDSLSYQIKDVIQKEIFPVTDFLVDLHGGNAEELLTPHGYYSVKASFGQDEAFNMLLATQTPLIYASKSSGGLYQSAAIDYDIPSILLEQGENGTCFPADVMRMKTAVLSVADYVFNKRLPDDLIEPTVFNQATYIDSPYHGCWTCFILPNQKVTKDQIIGEIHDIFGHKLCEVISPVNGRVLYQKATLVINQGELLVAIAH